MPWLPANTAEPGMLACPAFHDSCSTHRNITQFQYAYPCTPSSRTPLLANRRCSTSGTTTVSVCLSAYPLNVLSRAHTLPTHGDHSVGARPTRTLFVHRSACGSSLPVDCSESAADKLMLHQTRFSSTRSPAAGRPPHQC